MNDDLAVYIHWPFCKSKCPYCDFYKQVCRNVEQDKIIDEYLQNLAYYHELTAERKIKSIFFGGGTPSLIKPQNVVRIIDFIAEKWSLRSDVEISLEANPNSEYPNMFAELKNAGINRLSLGVQALNEADLRFLGRTHSLEQARKCIREITKIFSNHSVDLIYARPQQKMGEWEEELYEICSYGLKHISLYQLTIEEGTVFARKNVQPLEEEKAAQMYEFTTDFLIQYGYNRYEVSNFAQPGFASKHNLTYWTGGDYIGIGTSAHGRLTLNNQFIATVYPRQHEILTPQERAEELIIMGLRLTKGINLKDFASICGFELTDFVNQKHLENLLSDGFLVKNDENIYAGAKGMLVLNELIKQLCDR